MFCFYFFFFCGLFKILANTTFILSSKQKKNKFYKFFHATKVTTKVLSKQFYAEFVLKYQLKQLNQLARRGRLIGK